MTARAGQLVRLCGSSSDGEALAACRALGRLLQSNGLDWHWLADIAERNMPTVFPERPKWQIRAENLLTLAANNLTQSERHFLRQIASWRYEPSDRQMRWLGAIEMAMTGRCAA